MDQKREPVNKSHADGRYGICGEKVSEFSENRFIAAASVRMKRASFIAQIMMTINSTKARLGDRTKNIV